MEISKLSGEQLAEIINNEYQKLMQSNANILVIQKELDSRKTRRPEPLPDLGDKEKNV